MDSIRNRRVLLELIREGHFDEGLAGSIALVRPDLDGFEGIGRHAKTLR